MLYLRHTMLAAAAIAVAALNPAPAQAQDYPHDTGLADDQKVSFELTEGRDGRQMATDI